ncbi:MAG: RDD family protein [Deltaproteobacteria bacterium]|nr:RDD family protein [Deltaproteobacteria bacterium]
METIQQHKVEYTGFWPRVLASIIDSVLLMLVLMPFAGMLMGGGTGSVLINVILPAVAVIVFWIYKSATPGKMIIKAEIVDAKTFGKPTTGQFIGRYLAYYVSTIPFLLGFIWVAFDERKQGWHDKLAGTVVISTKARGQQQAPQA